MFDTRLILLIISLCLTAFPSYAGTYRADEKARILTLSGEQIRLLAKQGDIDAQFWMAGYYRSIAGGGGDNYCYWIICYNF